MKMIFFLWLIFILFTAEFFYILLFAKEEKPIKFKQIINKNGKKYYRVDHLRRSKGVKWQ